MAQLDKLSRFFVLRRGPLHDSIASALQAADARHNAMNQAHQHDLARLESLIQSHAQLTEQQASTTAELDSTRQALLGATHSLEQLQTKQRQDQEQAKLRFDALSTQNSRLGQERDQLEAARSTLEQTLEITRVELLASTEAIESLQQSLAGHQRTNAELAEKFQALQQRHGDTWTRFELISRLLAARPQESAGLARFRELLASDYMAFAESESSLAAEAKALTLLQSIEQELALLVSFPDVRTRTIVGIVGGFSSGKSEFINSFIDDPEVRLAVGLKPVTAIPSYVLATDERMIRGYSASGGHINLDVDFYKNVSHAFINSFSFDLKSLMPFMCVGVRMRPECLSDICFIDTPGYNPPSTAAEHSQGDRRTAVQFAQQADSIIWLIGLDSNGTVPDSDLEFIQHIGVEGRSVYVVLTKADLKAEEDIDDILEEVQYRLDDEGIQIEGVSAYSSTLREEVAYRKVPLLEHFARINRCGSTQQHLEKRLGEVFAMYGEAIQTDIAALKAQKVAINGLRLDCLEFGGQELYERMLAPIDKLTHSVDTSSLQAWLKESRRLHEAFNEAVQQTATALDAAYDSISSAVDSAVT
ncbi:dynamin family protein [Stutzerimonas xanthomarina]|uniref:dynamin family protein n=1 Tax=Stutzerimonas xanthomarina TaxID=271420 RepID=UPI0019090C7E|nr:dynamin family protein [Stutzerimonas xanthomarina]MBU0812557.1 dynamin family protein [Gammaproteobacteria bacterium]MBU0854018.1 dynamin family protein [Gammaproteobacteria bacterium]MBU1302238.1 dynamin family protein [Gammaproteobacteria bacterium]MBU1459618.1 dynamin family protein [Gammaproteobacteria bacterium]MBU1772828.1 dynamin family protein [Gammaproteobacteria bacterium]